MGIESIVLRCRQLTVGIMLHTGKTVYKVFAIYLAISAVLRFIILRLLMPMSVWLSDCYGYIEAGNFNLPLPETNLTLAVSLALLVSLMQNTLTAGWIFTALKLSRGGNISFHDLNASFGYFWKVWIIYFIRTAAIYIGLALFVVPGVYLLYRWRLSYYVLADDPKRGPIECLRHSAELTKGSKKVVFALDFSFWGSYLLAFSLDWLLQGVVILFHLPAIVVSFACFYNIRTGTEMPFEGIIPQRDDAPDTDDDDFDDSSDDDDDDGRDGD